MMRTRSAAHSEEKKGSTKTKGAIVKKTVRRMKIVQKKMKSSPKMDILNK